MNMKIMYKNKINLIVLQSFFIAMVSLFIFSGCSDTIKGELNKNLPPVVEFVNIPPEGQQFSRNPEVYWIGSDPDGLIDYYRYHIADTILVNGQGGFEAYAIALHDTDWVQINIDHDVADPHTTNVLPLIADTLNPVINPIAQFIILQAFDRENLGSEYIAKFLNRNDNPPETQLLDISNRLPFVNSVFEGGIVTGLRFNWVGSDKKDYDEIGLTPPPFDFEWRLFGPFDNDVMDSINTFLVDDVVVSNEAEIFFIGDEIIRCYDTTIVTVDSTYTEEICDTILVDSAFYDSDTLSAFYSRENIMRVEDPLIDSMIVDSSFNGDDTWVQNESDTLYNVYKNFTSDTTVEFNYIFWIRSRDDAFVKDLTPAFKSFPVINPQYERDIAVIDFTPAPANAQENHAQYTNLDTAKIFWYNTIHEWGSTRPSGSVLFDTSFFTASEVTFPAEIGVTGIDYIIARKYPGVGGIPIKYLLKHKVLILYNESYNPSGFVGATVNFKEVLTAMDAGINVWANWRNAGPVQPNSDVSTEINAPFDFMLYFGVMKWTYSAWIGKALNLNLPLEQNFRNEDFIGTYSINESEWPSLDVDSSLLRSRLSWHTNETGLDIFYRDYLGFRDTIAAVPEVNWCSRAPGTEVIYLYKSLYGPGFEDDYEGAPVGHRLESNFFRSVHFNFTMLTIEEVQAQKVSNLVLDWLYETALNSSTVQENRYKDAPNKISLDDARSRYDQRLVDQAEEKAASGL